MKKNIAFISTAHIHTKGFLDVIAKADDGRTAYAIWDDVAERGQRYAAACGARFVPELDTLLADPAVDGFIICAENTRHLPLLEKALPAGKPVFCEKPLVTSCADLAAVRALLAKHSTPVFCGYVQPFHGTMQAAAAVLAQEALGKVTRMRYFSAHHAAYGRWFDNPDLAWFHEPALSGGGAFMDMGTHGVHLARSLFGPVKEVFAIIENHSGEYPTVDDYGVAHLRFESGVLGTLQSSWTQTGGIGGLEVTGSKKTLWYTGKQYVTGTPGQEPEPVEPGPDKPSRVDRLMAVMCGEVPAEELKRDLEASMDAVAIMVAAYESARKGTWVGVRG